MTISLIPPLASAAFAVAESARAGSCQEDPVLEIVTFRLVESTDRDAFLETARGTEALLRERGSLVRPYLAQDEDGLWIDVIEWSSRSEALSAAEEVIFHSDFVPFGAMIDGSTVELRHLPILWSME